MKKLWSLWDNFWFAPQNTLNLAFMRVMLCGTLFYLYLMRLWNMEHYGAAAWISKDKAMELLHPNYRPPFLWYFFSDDYALFFHILLVLLLALMTLGIGSRLLMLFVWILDMAFIQRNYAVNFGADVIGALFLLYMSFTPAFERLSLLNVFRKRQLREQTDIFGSLFYRLMMFQISIIYAYTGFEKLKGGSWWEGTALWSVLGNPQMTTMDFSWLRHFPLMIAVLTFTTVIFEIYWPMAMFSRKLKHWFLGFGVLFHGGIAFSMGLGPFSAVMVSTYFLFVDTTLLKKTVSNLDVLKEKYLVRS